MAVGGDDDEYATGGVDSDANRRLAHGGLMAVGGEDEKPASDGVNARPRHTARSGLMAVGSGGGVNASGGVDASTHEYDELHTMEAPATHVVHPPRVSGKPGDATAAVGEPDWVTRQDLYSATSNSDSARSGPAASIDARVAAVVAAATAAAADTTPAPRSDAGSDVLMASVDLMRAKHMVDAVGMGGDGDGDGDGDDDGDGDGGSVSSGDVTHDSSGTFTSFASPHHQSHDTDRSDSPPGTPNPLRADDSDSGGKTRAAAHPRQAYGRKPTGAGVAGPAAASEMAYDTADSLPVPVDAVSPPRASMRAQRHAGGHGGDSDGDSDGGSDGGSGDSDGDGAGDLDDGTSRAELGLPHSDDGHSLGASQDDPAPRSPHRASARYRWSRDRELWHDHDTGDDTSGLDDGRAIRDDTGRYRRTRTRRVQRYHHVESRGHPLRRGSGSGSDGVLDDGDVGDEVFTDDPAFTPDEDDGDGDGDEGDGGDTQASGDVYSAYSGASASDDGAGGATNTTDLSMVHHELSDLHALLNKRAVALTERARAVAAREEKIKRDVTVAVARMAAQAHKCIMQVRLPCAVDVRWLEGHAWCVCGCVCVRSAAIQAAGEATADHDSSRVR